MHRRLATAALAVAAIVLGAPAAAQARTPCANETTTPTAANMAQVSDAVFCLTNQIRTSYGLPAFRRDTRLDTAARLHSQDMSTRNYFAHTNLDGLDPTARAAAQGYTTGVGENIAFGYANARAVVLGWMASSGHCANILGQGRELGVGSFGAGRTYYTEDFGNYDFNAGTAAAGGCPYTVDLNSIIVPDAGVAPPAGPAATSSAPASQTTAPGSTTVAGPAAQTAAAPQLGGLGLQSARLRAGGTVLTFTLSAPATVTLRFERASSGRRSGGRCARPTASDRRGARCTRYATVSGSLVADGVAGTNRVTLRPRLRGRTLAPGRYRLRAVATDAAGNTSQVRRVKLRVVGR